MDFRDSLRAAEDREGWKGIPSEFRMVSNKLLLYADDSAILIADKSISNYFIRV